MIALGGGELIHRLGPRYRCQHAAGWSSSVARRAHNPKVAGSNPAPATIESTEPPPNRWGFGCVPATGLRGKCGLVVGVASCPALVG